MIAGRHSRGWQTIIADLALILFMVTAAAMDSESRKADGAGAAKEAMPMRAEPLAVYRPSPGVPSLRQWLAGQAPDARQRLTIVSRYAPGEEEQAAQAALALATQAGAPARMLIEPSTRSEVMAVLAFDADGNWHADCKDGPVSGASRAAKGDNPCE
ncbi:MAG TPA: hypothetical protein VNR60_07425 [Croceibacterium sp.]|nr:hypothetical protein [Croceibacterium sp.]